MKRFFLILGIVLLVFVGYIWYTFKSGHKQPKGPRPVALKVSKHSEPFNRSVQSVLDAYYAVSEALVNWDTTQVLSGARVLGAALDSVRIDELKVDTTGIYESALDPLSNAKTATATIISEPGIDRKRKAFNLLSENLRLLFIVVKYDQGKLYWQECPMAFGNDAPGNWISQTAEVRNPYMGNKHPTEKDGMLHCGGPRDTINFMLPDTTRR